MGQDLVVRNATSLAAALATLAEAGVGLQVVMVDGALVFPTAPPPATWSEVRLRVADGMVTLRRQGDDDIVTLVVFGNASPALLAARDRIAAALGG